MSTELKTNKKKRIICIVTSIVVLFLLVVGLVLNFAVFPVSKSEPVPEKFKKDWDENTAFNVNDCKSVIIPEGEEPRILQLTDIHYDMNNNRKKDTLQLLNNVIKEANPHLIIVSGDWCASHKNAEKLSREVFDVIDSYGIAWAPIFGNHDMEGDMSRFDYADKVFPTYTNCMFDVGYTNIGGVGNYILNLFNGEEKNDKYIGSIFMIDSNTSTRKNIIKYIGPDKKQVDWYKWAVDGLNSVFAKDGEKIQSIMYMHIPIYGNKEIVANGQLVLGKNSEDTWPPYKDVGLLDAIFEKGSTKGVFFGHDHANNGVYNYKNILIGYGIESGWCKGYAEECTKGGMLLTIGENFNIKLEHVVYKFS